MLLSDLRPLRRRKVNDLNAVTKTPRPDGPRPTPRRRMMLTTADPGDPSPCPFRSRLPSPGLSVDAVLHPIMSRRRLGLCKSER